MIVFVWLDLSARNEFIQTGNNWFTWFSSALDCLTERHCTLYNRQQPATATAVQIQSIFWCSLAHQLISSYTSTHPSSLHGHTAFCYWIHSAPVVERSEYIRQQNLSIRCRLLSHSLIHSKNELLSLSSSIQQHAHSLTLSTPARLYYRPFTV